MGINAEGQEIGNASMTDGRDIPWLQDVDADADGKSDVWDNLWNVTWRDVVILDDENVEVGVFNLTEHDLAIQEEYNALRQMLIDTATANNEPQLAAGDANRDYRFDQLDLIQVLRGLKYGTGEPASWEQGDWNGDGVFDQVDLQAALQTGNYMQGPYAADDIGPFQSVDF